MLPNNELTLFRHPYAIEYAFMEKVACMLTFSKQKLDTKIQILHTGAISPQKWSDHVYPFGIMHNIVSLRSPKGMELMSCMH